MDDKPRPQLAMAFELLSLYPDGWILERLFSES